MSELPEGWAQAKLADLGDWSSGGTPSRSMPEYFDGDIPFVKTGDLADSWLSSIPENISQSGLQNSSAKLFPEGTLLVAMYGATIGKTARLSIEAATNQACAALLGNDANGDALDYVWAYLRSQRENLRASGKGGAQPNISQTLLKSYPIPLPPLSEQQRIVRKLDTLSVRTATARAHLTAIAKLVERYRSSVLKLAFEGALTTEWRAIRHIGDSASTETRKLLEKQRLALIEKNGKLRRARTAKADNHRIPIELSMPAEWTLTTMEDISSPVRLIQYGILKPGPDEAGGVPYVKVMNIKGGVVEPEKIRHTTNEIHQQYMRSSLKTGDLLLTIRGTVGRMAFVPKNLDGGNITQDTVRIDVLSGMNSSFVFWYFHSPQAQKYFQENKKGVAVQGINVGDVRPMEVPLPSQVEQEEVVRRIEAAFAEIDFLTAESAKALKLTDQLDQRIFAKAFAGQLVSQDPNDEPASVLLERIREARANAPKKPRTKPTKAKSMKVAPQERVLTDSAEWPEQGLPFEDIAKRLTLPHDDLKDAVFALLEGDAPKLRQQFDTDAKVMKLVRVAS